MPIDLGYSVSNGKWFRFANFVSFLCISVMFTFCLFSFCVDIYLLFPPIFYANYSFRLVSSTFPNLNVAHNFTRFAAARWQDSKSRGQESCFFFFFLPSDIDFFFHFWTMWR